MVGSAVALLLNLAIIFGVAWVICYILANYASMVPSQVQTFVWLIAALIAILKVIAWAGIS